MRFLDKKVFITGASRGIGRSIARAFSNEGAWVIGTCKEYDCTLKDDVCNDWFVADFSDEVQVQACKNFVAQTSPDILINNAGINKISPFLQISPDEFLWIQRVNVFAPFMFCQAAIPKMVENKWGRIVNISSVWGKVSKAHRASYSASKFALDGMTLALAAEHSADGILANCVAPGFVDTELTRRILGEDGIQSMLSAVPINRLAQTNEITRLVLWLASEENTYLTGQNIAIDGGFSRV
jgi:NAD(P)-dependent dehydrogenase (short-subunit alcohol dehydrogenase family)